MTQEGVHSTRRVWVPAVFLGAFAALVAGRLFQLQVLEHPRYAEEARIELLGGDTLYAARGAILDRNGNPLATSIDTWDIYLNRRIWSEADPSGESFTTLAELLGTTPTALVDAVRISEAPDVLVRRDLEYETGELVVNEDLTGVIALPNTDRVYPEGDTGASLLGFMGQDNIGLTGIEADYNDVLQGKAGRAIYERDSTGDPIPFGRFVREAPEPGKDMVLTIDRYLQGLAEDTLEAAIIDHQATGGSIIMMNPFTGEILAMASSPGLKYSTLDLDDPEQLELFRNRNVTDLYEPGSVMKVITTAAALDRGVVTPDTSYFDSGAVDIYGTVLRNWDYGVYGAQTMTGVLQNSINTGAVFMVERLGDEVFHDYLTAFGFGVPTGVGVSGEASGVFRTPDDEAWSPVDLATQSFGQSISVTPLQMITAVAAAINGGNLLQPQLVKALIHEDGTRQEIEPNVVSHPISEAASAQIRDMLESVVAMPYRPKPDDYTAGGKSGTADVPITAGYNTVQTIASFVGFAPADDPRVIILVKLDQNADGLTGTQAAGPVVASLIDDTLHYLNVRPDGPAYVRTDE